MDHNERKCHFSYHPNLWLYPWYVLWQGSSSTRHRSGFLWAPPTQDTGRCSTRDIYWSLQAGGIRRADGKLVMTLAPPRVCVLMAGLSWGAWLLMPPRCAAPPSQSPISLTQARWGCKPAINNTHPPHVHFLMPSVEWHLKLAVRLHGFSQFLFLDVIATDGQCPQQPLQNASIFLNFK